ncbi:phosphatidylserine/phosphatidylglycerophosphate/cardiolipin synthase family protein [Paraburkholderia bonniea]|uniref:phospholipase D-like domain-containing protein n=1 Tax=Paraburkholderia bonniea TaxID=2152891 RepID=UPI001290D054|nr:phosphatidylserine/phosphatidylglycerophosphate/cardiolipin synthase family protein [Paraburkholderia bonniea]WJF89098.1 phosphatidylserine/phosphatidylglycerophosphate/cardiolipin synthase family protein [Paraburkholderia bonniea]WJF92414.1 phosphatidylserine/phosphatidylglycerophosphate/cardiolipin synthase family protein [Paraburkholderia bonniea]
MKLFSAALAAIFLSLGNAVAASVSPAPSSAAAPAAPLCADSLADVPFSQLQSVRLDLIERAQAPQKIQILAYILNDDASGFELLQHLVRAAQRGVSVQLLADGIGPGVSLPLSQELIAAIQTLAPQFEIRIFNPKYRLLSLRNRMHDKLFLVGDDAVIGSSSTWDPSVRGGLIEKDILVRGTPAPASVLGAMHAHFQQFWQASQSVPQTPLQAAGWNDASQIYRTGAPASSLDSAALARYVSLLRDGQFAPPNRGHSTLLGEIPDQAACPRLTYIHDTPQKKSAGGTLEQIVQMLRSAKKEIVIVSPYVILVPEIREVLNAKIKNDGVHVVLLTTSITSMSAEFPAIGKAYSDDLPGLAKDHFEVREFHGGQGDPMLHSKIIRIDGQTFFVGSFNFDPLSALTNTENGLWIETSDAAASPFINQLNQEIAGYLAASTLIADGAGNLLVDDPARCDRANCSGLFRMLTPAIRNLL